MLIAWFVIPNHNIYSLVNICLYGIKKRLSLKCEQNVKNSKRRMIKGKEFDLQAPERFKSAIFLLCITITKMGCGKITQM